MKNMEIKKLVMKQLFKQSSEQIRGIGEHTMRICFVLAACFVFGAAQAQPLSLSFHGAENGDVSFQSADCTPVGENLVAFSAPSVNSNSTADNSLQFIASDYKVMLSSKRIGLCGRAKSSQGIFWQHVGGNWFLIFDDVNISCSLFEGDSPVTKKIILNGKLSCTHVSTND